ncbi:MAG: RsmE family RNA methyltransferase [Oligoflexia bacterium]|nr:RsmE family RNA methyltransferase [Oligoflexia bacterium]
MHAVLYDIDINIEDQTEVETETEIEIKIIDKKKLFHLTQVLRVKKSEKIVLLDGLGKKVFCEVLSVDRKELILKVDSKDECKRNFIFDLALCIPKKEYFEDIIKMSVELGFHQLIPVISKFSHGSNVGSEDRINRLIEAAMIQSKNPFKLNITKAVDFKKIEEELLKKYKHVFFFCELDDGQRKDVKDIKDIKVDEHTLIIIGAEGGFAEEEDDLLKRCVNIKRVHLPTQILRCPTAVCTAMGYVLANLVLDNS